jgi:hypothetical protein
VLVPATVLSNNQSLFLLPRLRNDVADQQRTQPKYINTLSPIVSLPVFIFLTLEKIHYHYWISMRFFTIALALSASTVLAAPTEPLYTIELAPGETRQVTESEKWALKAV